MNPSAQVNNVNNAPIFFVGMPRSGTTILFEAVARHPQLAWPSNYCTSFPRALWVNVLRRFLDNSVVRLYGRKKQYGRVLPLNRYLPQPDEAYEFWDTYAAQNLARASLLGVTCDEPTRSALQNAATRVMHWQNRPRFAAKFTGPTRIGFLHSAFPDATFVHIIRDGRAVVHSLMRVGFWERQGGFDGPFWNDLLNTEDISLWEDSARDPGILAGLQWRRVIESARREKLLLPPGNYIEVRYEDYLSEPHEVLRALFAGCGLPDANEVHDHIDSGPELNSMNKKFETDLTPQYIERLNASMEPVLSQLAYLQSSTL